MAVNFIDAFGIHPHAMALRGERMQLLASNVANQNTPRYQAVDLDVRGALSHFQETERLQDFGENQQSMEDRQYVGYRRPGLASQDRNSVEMVVEQAAFAQNTADFQVGMRFLNMRIKALSMAITGNP